MLKEGRGRCGISVRFAVTAPWGVEFQEYVIIIVHHNIFVVVGNDDLYWPFLFLGDWLRLDAWLDLAVKELLHEGANVLLGDLLLLVKGELLVLDDLLNGEGGPFAVLQIQVLRVGAESFCVNRGEVDFALMLLGKGLQGLG